MWGLPQKKNARRADKIRLCGHLRRYKKIVKKTYIICKKFYTGCPCCFFLRIRHFIRWILLSTVPIPDNAIHFSGRKNTAIRIFHLITAFSTAISYWSVHINCNYNLIWLKCTLSPPFFSHSWHCWFSCLTLY